MLKEKPEGKTLISGLKATSSSACSKKSQTEKPTISGGLKQQVLLFAQRKARRKNPPFRGLKQQFLLFAQRKVRSKNPFRGKKQSETPAPHLIHSAPRLAPRQERQDGHGGREEISRGDPMPRLQPGPKPRRAERHLPLEPLGAEVGVFA